MVCDNQAPHSLHFRNFWSNSLSHLPFLSFEIFNIHPAAIIFLSFAFLHPTARVGRRLMLPLRPNGEVSRARAAASGLLPTALVGECRGINHFFRFLSLFLPASLLCWTQRSLAKTYGGDFLRVFKIQTSMYFLPGDSLLVNSERVYRCTCYCIYLIKKWRTIGAQVLTFFLWEWTLLQVPHVRSIGTVQYAISNLTQVFWIRHWKDRADAPLK